MIHTLAYTALLSIALSSCNDDNAPILTQKDWDNTATYFKPTDENMFGTYYKPQLGYVGDPMPFYDPQAGDFKIMYLQEYRERPKGFAETAADFSFGQRHEESEDKRCKQYVPFGSPGPVQQGDACRA